MKDKDRSKEELLQELLDLKEENKSLKTKYQNELSENHRIKNKLIKSEEKYGHIVENAPIGIFRRSLDGQYNYCNLTLAKHFECNTIDEFLQNYHEIPKRWAKPEKHAEFKELLVKNGKVLGFEVETKLINGKTKWFSLYAYLDTSNYEVNGFSLDITERKQAEGVLGESQRKLATLMAYLPGLVYRCMNDSDWTMIFMSEGCFELTGFYPHELESNRLNSYGNLIHQLDANMVWQKVQDAINNRTFWQIEYRINTKDGKEKWVLEQGCGIYNNAGDLELLEGFISDITERKLAEQALNESKIKYFEAIDFQPAPIGIAMGDTIVHFNKEFTKTYGYTLDDVQSISQWMEIVYPDPVYREEVIGIWENDVANAIQTKSITPRREYLLTCKDLSVKWVAITTALVGDQLISTFENITERKLAEQALKENEEKFRTLFETSNDAIMLFNSGSWVDCNARALTMFGCSRERFIGSNPNNFSPPKQPDGRSSAELAIERINLAFEGKSQFFEWEHCKADGTPFTAEVSLNRLELEGKPYMQAIVRDLTERKKTVQSLIESEERYKLLINNIMYPVIVSSLAGQMLYINQKTADFLEIEASEIQNLKSPDYWVDPSKRDEYIAELQATGVVRNKEVRFCNKKNEIITVVMSSNMIDYYGQKAIFSIYNDITVRKRAEVELQQSKARLSALLSSMKDIVFEIDLNGCFEGYYSQDVKGLYVPADLFISKSFDEVLPPNVSNLLKGAIENIYKGKQFEKFEYSLTIDNNIQYENAIVTPRYDISNEIVGITVVCRDITERKFAERALSSLATNFAGLSGKEFFEAISKHIATEMGLDYVYVGGLSDTKDSVSVLGGFALGEAMGEMKYSLADTPCNDVIENNSCIYSDGVQLQYPKDFLLQQMGINSYLGARIYNKEQEPIGLLVALHSKPLNNPDILNNLFRIFLDRIAAEFNRMRADDALKMSEEKFSKAFQSSPDIIAITSLMDGLIVEVNDRMQDILEYSREEVIGKTSAQLQIWVEPPMRDGYVARLMQDGYLRDLELKMYSKSGKIIDTLASAEIIELQDKQYIFSTYRDITERKKAEEEIRFQNILLKTNQELALDGILIVDEKGNILSNNKIFQEVWEIPQEVIDSKSDEKAYNSVLALLPDPQEFLEKIEYLYRVKTEKSFDEIQLKTGKYLERYSAPMINDLGRYFGRVWFFRDITERKKAEKALKESNDYNRQLFSTSQIGLALAKMTGELVDINQAYADIIGYTIDETLQLTYWDVTPEKYAEKEQEQLESLYENGVYGPYEKEYIHKNGALVPVVLSGNIIERYGEKYIWSSVGNITARKQAEDQRRKSEEKFSKVFHVSPEAISINRLSDGKYIDANGACLNKTGFTREEIIGKTAIELNIWGDPEDRVRYIHAFEKDGKVRNLEMRLRMKSGEIRFFLASTEIIEVEDELCILGFFFDITDRKLAEEALRATTAKLETIIMVSPLAITVFDTIGNVQLWNKAAEQIFGWTAQEVIGHPNPIVPADILNEYTTWTSQIQQGKILTNQEGLRVRKDGSFVNVNISSASIKDIKGDLIGRMAILADISERKQAEENLKQSEERLSSFINSASDSFYLLDANLNFIEINRKALEFIGKQKIDIIGKNIADIVPDIKSSGRYEKHMEVVKTGIPFTIVDFIPHPVFGDKHVVLSSFKVGAGLGVIVYDITLLKKQELELKKLLKTIESTQVSIVVTDPEGIIEYANPFFTQLTGYSKDEYLGKNPKVLNSGTHTDEFYKEMWDTIKSGNTWEGEFCNIKKNGELYWEKSIITPIKNEKEEIINFVAVKSDITNEQKHKDLIDITLELYKKSEHLTIEEILKYSLELGIKLTDSEIGFFHFVNDNQETISLQAWSAKTMDICNIPTLDKHYPISKAGVWVDCFYQKKSVIHNDYSSLPHKKGLPEGHATLIRDLAVPVIIENQVVAIFGVGNKKLDYNMADAKFLSIFADNVWNVVRRKSAEIDAINAKVKAEESEKLKTAFLQNMSHEIRTPLNGILGFSNLLQANDLTNEDIKEFTGVIQKSGQRLMETVGNVLDMSKIETGQIEVENRSFSLNSLISNLFTFFSNTATVKDLILDFHVTLANQDSFIESDELKLNQILSNLINNSLKFTNNGKIIFGYSIIGNEIVFYVKDTGIGIPDEFKHRIFVRFAQVNLSISRGYEGAGLGLTICKGLVELLNGKIWFESEINVGSTFFFSIPYKPISLFPDENDISTILPPKEQIKILIVEDDTASYQYVKKLLWNTDCSLIHAENGREAVEIVKCTPDIKLILMDIRMPVMNGAEATKIIKQIRPDLPIVAQTAYAFNTERDEILSIGCSDYISKPIQKSDLFALIEKYS